MRMPLILSLVLPHAMAQPSSTPCPADVNDAIYQAMVACTAAADMTGGYLIQRFVSNLRSNQSFVRGDYCAGSLSPGCDSFGRLSSDPRANCDFPVYKTNYFNAFLEAPSICPSDADNTLEVALSTASEKVLGVDDGRKAVTLPRANDDSSPTFVFDFINHDFQSRQTD
ncbi:hypothetical protein As57867_011065, partial [Aphanomyces stellatus]